MRKKLVAVLILTALAALPSGAARKRPRSSPPPPQARGPLYSAQACQEAKSALKAGDLPLALEKYCDMLARPEGSSMWTVSVVLLCDPAEIPKALDAIREPQPVFVTKRVFEGRTCYRLCAGLTTDRKEAVEMRIRLPEAFKNAGPFPVEISFPCDPSIPGVSRPAASPAGKLPAPAREAAEPAKGPQQADVVELTPVAPQGQPVKDAVNPPVQVALGSAENPQKEARTATPFTQPALSTGPGLPPSPAAASPPPPARNPEAEAWFQKGLTAYNLGDRKLAEESYKRCLELSPDKPEALTNLGILYVEQKKYKDARGLFDAAVAKAPSYSRAHLGLAGALWGTDDYREGIEEARSAVNLDSHDVSARLTLASFLRAVGEEEEAMKQARMVLLMEPNNQKATEFVNSQPPKKVIKLKEKRSKQKGSQEDSK